VGQCALEDWHWIVNINIWNAIHGCHTFVDWLKRNPRGGHLINTASLAAIGSFPGMAAYNLTKAAVVSLSETLHAELRPHGVGVTVLCPSFFPTSLLDSARFSTEHDRRMAWSEFLQSRLTADAGLLITHPDVLLSPTKIAEATECQRRAVLQERVKIQTTTYAAVLGNVKHAFIEEILARALVPLGPGGEAWGPRRGAPGSPAGPRRGRRRLFRSQEARGQALGLGL
jgi:NAD(P)-dependent dehydrogenase (short-subunit alcohol dehydrogenase family)